VSCIDVNTTMSFFSGGTTAAATNTSSTAEKDIEVLDPPTDSISSLSFSSQADYLAVGSWDNSVRQEIFFLTLCILQSFDICFALSRCVSTKLVRMDRHKERQCINIKDRFWMYAGIKCDNYRFCWVMFHTAEFFLYLF
jgi:hypothetical protein